MKIINLSKGYGEKVVLSGLSLEAERGKITCVLGENGGGKTTLLNAVASLISYSGDIVFEDESEKNPAYIFQEPRLLPNLTVEKNLLLVRKNPAAVADVLKGLGLEGKKGAYPSFLSGGEKQRVAIARALLYNSDFFLLDEPFSALDIKRKNLFVSEFFKLWQEKGFTALFVTHSVDEAVALSHKVAVLSGGKIQREFTLKPDGKMFASSPVKEALYAELLK